MVVSIESEAKLLIWSLAVASLVCSARAYPADALIHSGIREFARSKRGKLFSCFYCVSFPMPNEELIIRGFTRSCLSVICRISESYVMIYCPRGHFRSVLAGAVWVFGEI